MVRSHYNGLLKTQLLWEVFSVADKPPAQSNFIEHFSMWMGDDSLLSLALILAFSKIGLYFAVWLTQNIKSQTKSPHFWSANMSALVLKLHPKNFKHTNFLDIHNLTESSKIQAIIRSHWFSKCNYLLETFGYGIARNRTGLINFSIRSTEMHIICDYSIHS